MLSTMSNAPLEVDTPLRRSNSPWGSTMCGPDTGHETQTHDWVPGWRTMLRATRTGAGSLLACVSEVPLRGRGGGLLGVRRTPARTIRRITEAASRPEVLLEHVCQGSYSQGYMAQNLLQTRNLTRANFVPNITQRSMVPIIRIGLLLASRMSWPGPGRKNCSHPSGSSVDRTKFRLAPVSRMPVERLSWSGLRQNPAQTR